MTGTVHFVHRNLYNNLHCKNATRRHRGGKVSTVDSTPAGIPKTLIFRLWRHANQARARFRHANQARARFRHANQARARFPVQPPGVDLHNTPVSLYSSGTERYLLITCNSGGTVGCGTKRDAARYRLLRPAVPARKQLPNQLADSVAYDGGYAPASAASASSSILQQLRSTHDLTASCAAVFRHLEYFATMRADKAGSMRLRSSSSSCARGGLPVHAACFVNYW